MGTQDSKLQRRPTRKARTYLFSVCSVNAACKRDAEIKIEKNNLKSRIVEKKYYTRIRIPDIDYRYSRKLEEEKLIKMFSTSTITYLNLHYVYT